MRKITTPATTLADLALELSGHTIPELVNLYSSPLQPKKHDSHVSAQFVGEWMAGCNSHVELWHEQLDNQY